MRGSVSFLPATDRLIAVADRMFTLAELSVDGSATVLLRMADQGVCAAAWSPDGARFATAHGHAVQIWTNDGVLQHTLSSRGEEVCSVAFSPDGSELLTMNELGDIHVVSPDSRTVRRSFGNSQEGWALR